MDGRGGYAGPRTWGFTGTSLLVDKNRGIVIALLTNRVNPSRDGDDATALRKSVSDVVYSFA
ncbi:hypothetical protein NHF46_02960 [Arthrobacter alpinus]|nr:hypothetical protein [Arthrobacter alpinus]